METKTRPKAKPMKIHLMEMTSLMVKTKRSRADIPNKFYNATLDKHIIDTLKLCEKGNLSVQAVHYPLMDTDMIHGMMGLKSYLMNFYYENTFCSEYSKEHVTDLYNKYCEKESKDPVNSWLNLYTIVYTNALICDYLKKDYGSLEITKDECKLVQKLLYPLGESDRMEILFNCAKHFTYGNLAYNNKAFDKIFPVISTSIKKKKLDKLLVLTD